MFQMSIQVHLQYYSMCSKCLPSAHMHALSRACHWLMDVSDVLLHVSE